MLDSETVILGLERFISDFKPFCGNAADWQRIYDAVDFLKEYEERGLNESCEDCKEYDSEKHYCPRFCRVIRTTVEELKENEKKRPVCEKCGKQIDYVVINAFNYDGSDSPYFADVTWDEEHKCATFQTGENWCGYELTDEERKDDIRCPECGEYPFDEGTEIEVWEPVEVIMWGKVVENDEQIYGVEKTNGE